MKTVNAALKFLTIARESWMREHNNDWDAEYMAGLFENARVCLERINDATEEGYQRDQN